MKTSQQLEIRSSEIRSELATLASSEAALTDDEVKRTEALRTELQDCETKRRAALTAEAAETEQRSEPVPEMAALTGQASLGRALQNIAQHRSLDGAEFELQRECGLAGNALPWQLLEQRAVSPAPGDVAESMDSTVLGRVFPMSSLSYINAARVMVDASERIFPVLVAGPAPATVAKDAAVDETAGAWQTTTLAPRRLGASILVRREDMAVFPVLESSLRADLSMALDARMDEEVLAEVFKASSPRIPAAAGATAVATFSTGLALATGGIDGERASTLAQVKLLVGSETYRLFAGLERSTGAGIDLLEYLSQRTGGIKTSARIAAPDSTNQRQEALRINGMYRSIVVPQWQGVMAIVDSTSLANRGQLRITLDCLWNYAILRAADYTRLSVKVS